MVFHSIFKGNVEGTLIPIIICSSISNKATTRGLRPIRNVHASIGHIRNTRNRIEGLEETETQRQKIPVPITVCRPLTIFPRVFHEAISMAIVAADEAYADINVSVTLGSV